MDVVCNNPSCSYAKKQKIFSVDSISKGECPSCHGHSLLPSWAAQFQTIADQKTREKIHKTTSKVKNALPKKSKKSSQSSSKRSIDRIEFSYHEKLDKLSKAIKKDKAMQKFDSIDKDVLKSIVNAKGVNLELNALQQLFGTFKKQSAKKKTSIKKAVKKINKKPITSSKVKKYPLKKKTVTQTSKVTEPKPSEQPPNEGQQAENFFT